MPEKTSVLFVCLGNICRSTMAEGIFRHEAQKPEWKDKIGRIDSCGTGTFPLSPNAYFFCGLQRSAAEDARVAVCADRVYPSIAAYHTGDEPDDRTMATLEENGITDYDHAARRVRMHASAFMLTTYPRKLRILCPRDPSKASPPRAACSPNHRY